MALYHTAAAVYGPEPVIAGGQGLTPVGAVSACLVGVLEGNQVAVAVKDRDLYY